MQEGWGVTGEGQTYQLGHLLSLHGIQLLHALAGADLADLDGEPVQAGAGAHIDAWRTRHLQPATPTIPHDTLFSYATALSFKFSKYSRRNILQFIKDGRSFVGRGICGSTLCRFTKPKLEIETQYNTTMFGGAGGASHTSNNFELFRAMQHLAATEVQWKCCCLVSSS